MTVELLENVQVLSDVEEYVNSDLITIDFEIKHDCWLEVDKDDWSSMDDSEREDYILEQFNQPWTYQLNNVTVDYCESDE